MTGDRACLSRRSVEPRRRPSRALRSAQIVPQLPPHVVVARSVMALLRDFGEQLPDVPQPILLYLCQARA